MATIVVNGVRRDVQAPTDTPLLYVLRGELELSGPQFGCGLAQCGACSVLLDGKEIRSCTTSLSAAAGKEVTTLEGIACTMGHAEGAIESGRREDSASGSGSVDSGADTFVRLLPKRHDDQGDGTVGARRLAYRRRNQSRLYDVGAFGASLPLRKLHRDYRGRATRRHNYGKSAEVKEDKAMSQQTNQVNRIRRRPDAPWLRENRRCAGSRLRHG